MAVVGFFAFVIWLAVQGFLLSYLFGYDVDAADEDDVKFAMGCGAVIIFLIGGIVLIVGSILDAKGILPRNGDGDFEEFVIKWLIISYGGLLAVSVIACLVKVTFSDQFRAVGTIMLCAIALLVLWGIAFLVGNILSGELIPDSAVDGNINGYIFKRGGVAVACILCILTIVRLIRATLPGDQNNSASESTNTPPPPPIHRERKSCPTYKFWIGNSKEGAPDGFYTDVSSARPIGQVGNKNGHIGCYAFGGHNVSRCWCVWIHRSTPDTFDAPSVIFRDGEIRSYQRYSGVSSLLATYGDGEIRRNNKLVAVYEGPDTGGAATAALLFGWVW